MTRRTAAGEESAGGTGNRSRTRTGHYAGPDALLRVIGYARVSTDEQAKGWGLPAQRELMEKWCADHGAELVAFFIDVMSSRRIARLVGREGAVAAVEAGAARVLLVRALDRASRSVLDGAGLIERAKANGWRLVGVDGTDSADENQELAINARLMVAQEERKLISRRTKEALARVKAQGKHLGRPPNVPGHIAAQIVERREKDSKSYRAIAADLDAAGEPTPGGAAKWRADTVREVYRRVAEVAS